MGKAKRDRKREREERKEREAEQQVEQARLAKKRRMVIAAVPILTIAGALTAYFAFDSRSMAGAIALGGAMIWLLVGLGYLGGSVKPKDRGRAGSIDFGQRRR